MVTIESLRRPPRPPLGHRLCAAPWSQDGHPAPSAPRPLPVTSSARASESSVTTSAMVAKRKGVAGLELDGPAVPHTCPVAQEAIRSRACSCGVFLPNDPSTSRIRAARSGSAQSALAYPLLNEEHAGRSTGDGPLGILVIPSSVLGGMWGTA